MKVEAMPVSVGDYNLTNYDEKVKQFELERNGEEFFLV